MTGCAWSGLEKVERAALGIGRRRKVQSDCTALAIYCDKRQSGTIMSSPTPTSKLDRILAEAYAFVLAQMGGA